MSENCNNCNKHLRNYHKKNILTQHAKAQDQKRSTSNYNSNTRTKLQSRLKSLYARSIFIANQIFIIIVCISPSDCANIGTLPSVQNSSNYNDNEANDSFPVQRSPRLYFANNPDGSNSIIGTWFSFTSFTIMMAFFGTSFLLACAATAAYYVLIVVTEPTQQGRSLNPWSPASWLQSSKLSNSNHWTFTRIVQLIHLAYETYSTLDLDNLECQEKILCEFQRTAEDGSLGELSSSEFKKSEMINLLMRKIMNFLMYLDYFKTIPHIRQYQEAVEIGQMEIPQNATITSLCDAVYAHCAFSVKSFNKYYTVLFE